MEATGEYFVGRCTVSTVPQTFMNRKFLAAGIDGAATTEFNPFDAAQRLSVGPFYSESAGANITPPPLVQQVWAYAQAEWGVRFP